MYATLGITAPDWSPTGTTIAYQRLGTTNQAPVESIGIHLFDLSSAIDRPLTVRDTIQFGTYPIWSPHGDAIAVRQNFGSYWRITLIQADGSALRPLMDSPIGTAFTAVRRHFDAVWGGGLLLDVPTNLGTGPFLMSWDGSGLHKLPRAFRFSDAYSDDGLRGVGSRYDPTDSLTALFVYTAGDFTGATYHQITHYAPPHASSNILSPVARTR